MTSRCAALVAFSLLVGLQAEANADAPPGKAEYDRGVELFKAGKTNEACKEFQRAYDLAGPRRSVLFYQAQCARQKGQLAEAIGYYRAYLATKPKDPARVRQTIVLLEKELLAQAAKGEQSEVTVKEPKAAAPPPPPSAAVTAPPPAPAPTSVKVAPPPAADSSSLVDGQGVTTPQPGTGPSGLKIGLLSGGGAAVIAGGVFAVLAATTKSSVKEGVRLGDPISDLESDANAGFAYALTADAMVGVGLTSLVIGLLVD